MTLAQTGINNYYLYSCNATIRAEALNAVRAAGLKVLRVVLLSTEGGGAVAACSSTPVPDVEPVSVGKYDDSILERLDDLLHEAALRGIKVTVALHDRWSLGCRRSDAYQRKFNLTVAADCERNPAANDPARFYADGRADFQRRIEHVLRFVSRHTEVTRLESLTLTPPLPMTPTNPPQQATNHHHTKHHHTYHHQCTPTTPLPRTPAHRATLTTHHSAHTHSTLTLTALSQHTGHTLTAL